MIEGTEEGSREDLIRRLDSVADGCLGRDDFRSAAAEAARHLSEGEPSVKVGRTEYRVTEP